MNYKYDCERSALHDADYRHSAYGLNKNAPASNPRTAQPTNHLKMIHLRLSVVVASL
jgi:hypothetical protein